MDEPPSIALLNIFSFQGIAHPFVLLGIAVLLLSSGLVSASEAAFFSLQSKDLSGIGEGRRKSVVRMLENPQLLWTTLLVTNITLKVGLVTLVSLLWADGVVAWPLRLVIATVTVVLVLVCEVVPKIFGRRNNTRTALATVGIWRIMQVILEPISAALTRIRKFSPRKGIGQKSKADALSHAIEIAAGVDGASEGEKDILKGIAIFGTLTVIQVMRIRTEISAVNVKSTFSELMDFVNRSGFSRIPVFENTLDRIAGVLYVKDLLPFLEKPADFEWQSLVRPGFFVPETKKIDLLLKDFQEKRVHMAIVTGEYGGTVGLVTLEDLIEEIIGEINDEFDEVEYLFRKIDDRTFVFDGKTLLVDLSKSLELDPEIFAGVKGISETVSGLVLEINKKFPKAGDQINFEQFTFVVESVDRKRIKRVRVKVNAQA